MIWKAALVIVAFLGVVVSLVTQISVSHHEQTADAAEQGAAAAFVECVEAQAHLDGLLEGLGQPKRSFTCETPPGMHYLRPQSPEWHLKSATQER